VTYEYTTAAENQY